MRAVLRFRLKGIDCPEVDAPGGATATAFTTRWLAEHGALVVTSWKSPGAYGRWEGVIAGADGAILNADLVAAGLATKA